jgi:hypothetical protein
MKSITALILLVIVIILGTAAWFFMREKAPQTTTVEPTPTVTSFEECAAAGYPVMESNPRQCKTPDGRTYAEEPTPAQAAAQIIYKNASADKVVVTNPTPGAVTGKSFTVTGKARGTWYFEASFPVEVRDKNGTVLAKGVAQAQGDWMTEDFVPFKVDLTVPNSYIGPATLVLHKDNPSGLPQNEASVTIPFTIEY